MATKRIKGGKRLEAFLRKAKNAKSTNNVKEVEVGFYSPPPGIRPSGLD